MLTKKVLGTFGVVVTTVLIFSGCSTESSKENTSSSTPSATATPPAPDATVPPAEPTVPSTVAGPEWCTDVYKLYTSSVSSPVEAGNQMKEIANSATEQPNAQTALNNFADFLSQQNPENGVLSEADTDKFTELDNAVNAQFAENCGGKSIIETVVAEAEQNTPPENTTGTPSPSN